MEHVPHPGEGYGAGNTSTVDAASGRIRFRLHDRKLPGKPDIVFPKYHTAIFVNGCYWHRHESCPKTTTPKTRTDFWKAKFKDTVERDKRNAAELVALGWRAITVWECELEDNQGNVLGNLCLQLKEVD